MFIDNSKKQDVVLIGGYPPPFGGIAVHIMRLQDYLIHQNINCQVLDIRFRKNKNNNIFSILNVIKIRTAILNNSIIHLHVSSFGKLFRLYLIFLLFKNQKKIITIHSGSFIDINNNRTKVNQKIFRYILGKVDEIIVVNQAQRDYLLTSYSNIQLKISVIPAFIFPKSNTFKFNERKLGQVSLVASGAFYEYYGFEMILSFLKEKQDIQATFVFNGPCDKIYRKKILEIINSMSNVRYYENMTPVEFNSILKKSDIYVRNTDRDGDCVTIREAGFWGLQIIASDLPSRPIGIELIPYNNLEIFEKTISKLILNSKLGVMDKPINNASKIIELYKESIN